jgi:hypothetical protein
MKTRFLTLSLIATALFSSAHAQSPLVEQYVGSGSKTAFLVLDFQPGASYTFGYRYDGVQTTGDMIASIDTALSSFVADMPGDRNSGFGRFINGFGYGSNALSSFTANFNTPPYFGWNYYASVSPLTTIAPLWAESSWGVDGKDGSSPAGTFQSLDTHVWSGFTWGRYDTNTFAFLGSSPTVNTAAAPEPGTLALIGLGTALFAIAQRRRRADATSGAPARL